MTPKERLVCSVPPIDWLQSDRPVPYPEALATMEARAAAIRAGTAAEAIWFLEHPPLYTAGVSARETDLLGKLWARRTGNVYLTVRRVHHGLGPQDQMLGALAGQ